MNADNIFVVVTRHAEKAEPNPKPKPGSDEDKYEVHLSEEGRRNSFAQGEAIIQPHGPFDSVVGVTSTFVRVNETIEAHAKGAMYTGEIAWIEKPQISLAGSDWKHPSLGAYSSEPEMENAWVIRMLQGNYYPHEGAPSVARYGAEMFDGFAQGVARVMQELRNGADSALLEQGTHGPVLDSFAAAVFNYLDVDAGARRVTLANFPPQGNYRYGQMITGHADDLSNPDNPVFRLQGKGLERVISLDEVKMKRDEMYAHAQR